jgi:hypothetical protein
MNSVPTIAVCWSSELDLFSIKKMAFINIRKAHTPFLNNSIHNEQLSEVKLLVPAEPSLLCV